MDRTRSALMLIDWTTKEISDQIGPGPSCLQKARSKADQNRRKLEISDRTGPSDPATPGM